MSKKGKTNQKQYVKLECQKDALIQYSWCGSSHLPSVSFWDPKSYHFTKHTGHCQSVFNRNKARGGLGGRLPGSAAVLWLLFSPPQPPRMEKVSQGGSAVHKPLGWRGPEVAMVFSTQGTRKLWLFQPSWGLIVENLSRALNKFCFMIF